MTMNIYAIRDLKTGFLAPTLDQNDAIAKRSFMFALNRPGTLEYSNAQDYDLFKIGEYDNDTGIITHCDKELVAQGSDLLKKENENG